ncbi:hypothetical protein B0H19DRAFT_1056974 [Mycena capillaripes]|nr:hypothetical protein B0H19DRAFT_1056974 [Mycena capillaripes]
MPARAYMSALDVYTGIGCAGNKRRRWSTGWRMNTCEAGIKPERKQAPRAGTLNGSPWYHSGCDSDRQPDDRRALLGVPCSWVCHVRELMRARRRVDPAGRAGPRVWMRAQTPDVQGQSRGRRIRRQPKTAEHMAKRWRPRRRGNEHQEMTRK